MLARPPHVSKERREQLIASGKKKLSAFKERPPSPLKPAILQEFHHARAQHQSHVDKSFLRDTVRRTSEKLIATRTPHKPRQYRDEAATPSRTLLFNTPGSARPPPDNVIPSARLSTAASLFASSSGGDAFAARGGTPGAARPPLPEALPKGVPLNIHDLDETTPDEDAVPFQRVSALTGELSTMLDRLTRETEDVVTENEDLARELDSRSLGDTVDMQRLQRLAIDSEQAHDQVLLELNQAKESLDKVKRERDAATEVARTLENELMELRAEQANLKRELDECMRAANAVPAGAVEDLREELAAARAERDRARAERELAQEELYTALAETSPGATDALKSLKDERDGFEAALMRAMETMKRLEDENSGLVERANRLSGLGSGNTVHVPTAAPPRPGPAQTLPSPAGLAKEDSDRGGLGDHVAGVSGSLGSASEANVVVSDGGEGGFFDNLWSTVFPEPEADESPEPDYW